MVRDCAPRPLFLVLSSGPIRGHTFTLALSLFVVSSLWVLQVRNSGFILPVSGFSRFRVPGTGARAERRNGGTRLHDSGAHRPGALPGAIPAAEAGVVDHSNVQACAVARRSGGAEGEEGAAGEGVCCSVDCRMHCIARRHNQNQSNQCFDSIWSIRFVERLCRIRTVGPQSCARPGDRRETTLLRMSWLRAGEKGMRAGVAALQASPASEYPQKHPHAAAARPRRAHRGFGRGLQHVSSIRRAHRSA